MNSTALLRAAVTPVLAAAFGVMAPPVLAAGVLAAPAQAAPMTTQAPQLQFADDDTTVPERPLRIQIGRFEPRTLTPGATVTVTGTLVNTGPTALTDLQVRLQRGDVVDTRAELAALTRDPDPATAVLPGFQRIEGEIPAGGELDFTYTIDSAELRLDRDGVYPVLLNVNGTTEGEGQRRVGELSTYVIQQPLLPAARTAVAWLWPLVERTHRTPSGRFADDGLTESISDDGRLDRAVDVLERLPVTEAPGQGDAVPALRVTLAIDPALVEELEIMASGPYEVGQGTGDGTDEAAAFLDRLRALADVHPVVALPYGDADADALQATGLPEVLTRTLPGTPAGTAQDPPEDDEAAAGTSAPASATGSPAPEAAEERRTGAGAEILARVLDVEPRTDVAWPAGGSLRTDTIGTLRAGGVRGVVLGTGALTDGETAVGLSGNRATVRTEVSTPEGGTLGALVADPTLGEIAGAADHMAGGPRMAEQRYLAELAAIGLQAPAGTLQTVLVAPPRTIDAGPDGAGAMLADTAALPWLQAATLDELAGTPAASAGQLVEAGDAVHLDPVGLAAVADAVASRDDLAAAVSGDADAALQSFDAAVARSTSVAWRSDPEGFRTAADVLKAQIERLRGQVSLLAPADGTYSLASSDSPLILTVQNDLPVAVDVRLEVRTRTTRGLSIGDIGVQTLAPGERTTLQVPTQVRQSGGFAVTAQLTTPDGTPLGEEISLQVKSTAYGSISLIITIGAAALLGLLFLRRLVNFVLRRRRAAHAAAEIGPGAPEGAGVLPPNRSPV